MSLDNGIVLPGITRESIIALLEQHAAGSSDLLEGLDRKVRVVQRDISMPEIVSSIADGTLKA
jgi:branched-chain amino acid aminotransferase